MAYFISLFLLVPDKMNFRRIVYFEDQIWRPEPHSHRHETTICIFETICMAIINSLLINSISHIIQTNWLDDFRQKTKMYIDLVNHCRLIKFYAFDFVIIILLSISEKIVPPWWMVFIFDLCAIVNMSQRYPLITFGDGVVFFSPVISLHVIYRPSNKPYWMCWK